MTIASFDIKTEQESLLLDVRTPDQAMERRYVAAAAAVTFSSSLEPGNLYYVQNESNDSIAFVRIDGNVPVLTYGVDVSVGLPVGPFEKFPLQFTTGPARQLRVIVSGSANITLFAGGIK